ncbi:MAG: tripartite tricarboxylate transporter permease [Paracoccaceae bacterium]
MAGFWIGNVFCLILNFPLRPGIWVRMLRIYYALYPAILFFICLGVYSINYNVFDIFVVIVFGLIGTGMLRHGFPAAPLLLGFILGPMIEENLRRALLISRGDVSYLGSSMVSAGFLIASALVIVLSMRGGIAAAAGALLGGKEDVPSE